MGSGATLRGQAGEGLWRREHKKARQRRA